MSCALCPTPFAQQHLKLLGPPNSGRSVAEWAPSLKRATDACVLASKQRLPRRRGPPGGMLNRSTPRLRRSYSDIGHYSLGSSLSSEPRGLTGLSVASHAGVLTRSKISGSLLHRLSRPWHAIYGARAQIFFACAAGDRSSSCSAIAASASSSSDSRCCFLSALRRHLAK